MSNTIVKTCSCQHDYQDKLYGKGRRLHNCSQGKDKTKCSCTVCGNKKAK